MVESESSCSDFLVLLGLSDLGRKEAGVFPSWLGARGAVGRKNVGLTSIFSLWQNRRRSLESCLAVWKRSAGVGCRQRRVISSSSLGMERSGAKSWKLGAGFSNRESMVVRLVSS